MNELKASVAREIAEKYLTDTGTKIFNEILKAIKNASYTGIFSIYWYNIIPNQVVIKLKKLGYKFQNMDERDGSTSYTIKW